MSVAWNCEHTELCLCGAPLLRPGVCSVPDCVCNVEPAYQPRWVRDEDWAELINLYHLSRTALAGDRDEHSKWARMQWASREFAKAHDYVTSTGAYKDLSNMLWR